jgi:predicted O-methyltransferase YrrM
VVAIGPGGGAALRFLASVLDARAVAEFGTGTGVSGLWLLRGMRPDGVLTSVDTEAEHQRLARKTFTEAGIPAQRDEDTVAIRELGRQVAEHDGLVPVLLPVGDGLLAAKKVWVPES